MKVDLAQFISRMSMENCVDQLPELILFLKSLAIFALIGLCVLNSYCEIM